MDSDFTEPTAHNGKHGTWMDVFSGGNVQVRADALGVPNLEAVVVQCHADHAVLQLRRPRHNDGGGRVEVNIGQIKEWRHATPSYRTPTATPGNTPVKQTASTAEAPSAHNRKARGGGRQEVDVAPATSGAVITHKSIDDTLVDLRKLAGL
jgi:hypothetical protein